MNTKTCAWCKATFQTHRLSRKYCKPLCGDYARQRITAARIPSGGIDGNHAAIVKALRACGATVASLADVGSGVPDIVVGWKGANYLLEIKNPASRYGRSGLNANQQAWASAWRGLAVIVVTSVEEALEAVGAKVAA